jgi:hypothetical protein
MNGVCSSMGAGGERPFAFWWRVIATKNVVHGLLRT